MKYFKYTKQYLSIYTAFYASYGEIYTFYMDLVNGTWFLYEEGYTWIYYPYKSIAVILGFLGGVL